jgi:hypothetical protein
VRAQGAQVVVFFREVNSRKNGFGLFDKAAQRTRRALSKSFRSATGRKEEQEISLQRRMCDAS